MQQGEISLLYFKPCTRQPVMGEFLVYISNFAAKNILPIQRLSFPFLLKQFLANIFWLLLCLFYFFSGHLYLLEFILQVICFQFSDFPLILNGVSSSSWLFTHFNIQSNDVSRYFICPVVVDF